MASDPIEEKANEILAVKREIESLDALHDTLRDELKTILVQLGVTPDESQSWEYEQAKVTWVKGRTTSKLDRKLLALAGVDAAVIDNATVTSVGEPSVRVEAR